MTTPKTKTRCPWAANDPLMQAYHDNEWGRPERDSRALWEALMLDGFQAGLSWITILRKREAFRKAFHNFDPAKVARFTEKDIERLLQNADIIRSRAKIEATINGARIYQSMLTNGEDFSTWIWTLAGGKPIHNHLQTASQIPAKTPTLRRDLRSPQKARLQIRRSHHHLCMDASLRDSGRPHSNLFPL